MESSDSVKVVVRIRPQSARERLNFSQICVSFSQENNQIVIGNDRCFTFDKVYGPDICQDLIYTSVCEQLIDACLKGYNATVFAYGQTGSGKTYSMGTAFDVTVSDQELGIIPRAVKYMFEKIDQLKQPDENHFKSVVTVHTEFIELYNESIKDLLDESCSNSDTKKATYRIHQDANGNIYTVGSTRKVVTNCEETMDVLRTGAMIRTTASTNMNDTSSRSHAVFTIHIKIVQYFKNEIRATYTSKFNFVDLAGSERLKRTGATGERRKEGISINMGLLALGNVISALGDESKTGSHVPYRDSKLTRLLQDSLGGNSKTLMISCISPSDVDLTETLNTLKYSNRAKNIKNVISVNQDASSRTIETLQNKIIELQKQLNCSSTCKNCGGSMLSEIGQNRVNTHPSFEDSEDTFKLLNAEIKNAYSQIKYLNTVINAVPVEHLNKIELYNNPQLMEDASSHYEVSENNKIRRRGVPSQNSTTRRSKSDTENEQASEPSLLKKSKSNVDLDHNTSLKSFDSTTEDEEDEHGMQIQENIDRISEDIFFKEKLIKQLEKSENKMKTLRCFYEEKIFTIEKKVSDTENEKVLILDKLEKNQHAVKIKNIESDYNQKLDRMRVQIKMYRDKKISGPSEVQQQAKRVKLQNEVSNLKKEKVKLFKKIKEATEQKKNILIKHSNLQAQYTKSERVNKNKIKQLTTMCNSKDNVLKRKQVELESVRKKVRLNAKTTNVKRKLINFNPNYTKDITNCIVSLANKKVRYNELEKDMDLWCKERNSQVYKINNLEKEESDATEKRLIIESFKATLEFSQEKIKHYSSSILNQERIIKQTEAQLTSLIVSFRKYDSSAVLQAILNDCVKVNMAQIKVNAKRKKATQLLHYQKTTQEIQRDNLMYLTRNMSSDEKQVFNDSIIQDVDIQSFSESDDNSDISVAETIVLIPKEKNSIHQGMYNVVLDEGPDALLNTESNYKSSKSRKTLISSNTPITTIKFVQDSQALKNVESDKNTTFCVSSSPVNIEQDAVKNTVPIDFENLNDVTIIAADSDTCSVLSNVNATHVKSSSSCISSEMSRNANIDVKPRHNSDDKMTKSQINVFSRLTTNYTNIDPLTSKGTISNVETEGRRKDCQSCLEEVYQACGHTKAVSDVFATHDKMFTASKDRSARIWDLNTGSEIASYRDHLNYVSLVRYIEPLNFLITASNYVMNVYDTRISSLSPPIYQLLSSGSISDSTNRLKTDAENRQLSNCPPKECIIFDVSICPNNRFMFSTCGLIVRYWDIRQFKYLGRLYASNKGPLTALYSSYDEKTHDTIIATGSKDHHIKVFKVHPETDKVDSPLESSNFNFDPPHYDGVESLYIHEKALYSSSRDMSLRKWDIGNVNLQINRIKSHEDWIVGLNYLDNVNFTSVNGRRVSQALLSVCRAGYLKLWNAKHLQPLSSIKAHSVGINAVRTNKENFVFTASEDATVKIWKTNSMS